MPLQLLKDAGLCVCEDVDLRGAISGIFFSAACNRDSSGDVEFTDQRECWLYDVLMLYSNYFWAIVSEKLTGKILHIYKIIFSYEHGQVHFLLLILDKYIAV